MFILMQQLLKLGKTQKILKKKNFIEKILKVGRNTKKEILCIA